MVNLDTHIVVHALAGTLQPAERAALEGRAWGISAIVLWELAKLVQLGRLSLDMDDPTFLRFVASVRVWPIDTAVALQSTRLDLRSDPADELIAATSIVHGVPLLTRDARLLASKIVPLALRA